MTNKEAYKIIRKSLDETFPANSDEWNKALCCALQALEDVEEFKEILRTFSSQLAYEISSQTNPYQVMRLLSQGMQGKISGEEMTELKGYYEGLKTARAMFSRILCERTDPERDACEGCEFSEFCNILGFDTGGGD